MPKWRRKISQMGRYRISPRAREDLKDIYRYIAQDNQPAAKRLNEKFIERFQFLADAPQSGELRQDLADIAEGIRTFSLGNFVIYFRAVEKGIEIARVARGARDAGRLMSG